jgi:hypothetical protein
MNRKRNMLAGRLLLGAALAAGMAGVASANRGGGDSGDSSMNPFTGDSYAYFHNGHNLGEEGMIRPGRVPPRPSKPVWERKASGEANHGNGNAASTDKKPDGQRVEREGAR